MSDQQEFFSPNHKRLLNMATWAKYLARVVLVTYIFNSWGVYLQEHYRLMYSGVIPGRYTDLADMSKHNVLYAFSLFIQIISVLFKGVVYFLSLTGMYMGLNMIVETDINYREQKKEEGMVQK